jgi:hypothetical protein
MPKQHKSGKEHQRQEGLGCGDQDKSGGMRFHSEARWLRAGNLGFVSAVMWFLLQWSSSNQRNFGNLGHRCNDLRCVDAAVKLEQ